uniref:Uncharacterized protein n=1 Tax=Arundo donax TaxID=35708 RepID=A0A0A9BWA0_ARUDO
MCGPISCSNLKLLDNVGESGLENLLQLLWLILV